MAPHRVVLVFCLLTFFLCDLEMVSAKLGPDPLSISFSDGFLFDMSPIVSPEFLLAAFSSIDGEASLVLVRSDTYQLSVISKLRLWHCYEPQLVSVNSDAVLVVCPSSIALVTVTDFSTITISRRVAVPNLGRPFVPAIGLDNLESLWFFQNDTLFRFDITSFRLAVVATDVWKSTPLFWAGAASPKSILVGFIADNNETLLIDGNSGTILTAQPANMYPVPVIVTATNGFTVDSANVGSLRVTNWNWNTLTPKPKTFSIPSSMPVSTGRWQMSYGSSFFAVGAYRYGGSTLSQVGIDATGEATAVLDQVSFEDVGLSAVTVGMDEKHVFVSIYPDTGHMTLLRYDVL